MRIMKRIMLFILFLITTIGLWALIFYGVMRLLKALSIAYTGVC